MSMSSFTQENCNGWLIQVATARDTVLNINKDKTPTQFYGERVALVWVTFVITVFALAIMLILACLQHGSNKRDLGAIMFIWMIAQIPSLDFHSVNFATATYDANRVNASEFRVQQLQAFSGQQQQTIFLILCIWWSVYIFKKAQVEFIDHVQIRNRLSDQLNKEFKVGLIMTFLNLIFQVPLFSIIARQVRVSGPFDISDPMLNPPQALNRDLANFTIFVGLMVALLITMFLALMVWQLSSLIQVIQLSINVKAVKSGLYLSIPILTVLYINDVFSMMLYYWGSPSFNMTRVSYSDTFPHPFVNTDMSCHSRLLVPGVPTLTQGTLNQLTGFGTFLAIIFSVSEVSPLIWTIFFSVGFLTMQYATFIPIHYNKKNPRKYGLIKPSQGAINYTDLTNLTNTGQTMDQSRNV